MLFNIMLVNVMLLVIIKRCIPYFIIIKPRVRLVLNRMWHRYCPATLITRLRFLDFKRISKLTLLEVEAALFGVSTTPDGDSILAFFAGGELWSW